MPIIHVDVEGDNAWSDLRERLESHDPTIIQAMGNETIWHLTILEGGMLSGRYSVGLRLDLSDGRVIVAETSWDAFKAAFGALNGKIEPRPQFYGGGRFA
mgnify:CR=1 FL=1